MKRLLLILFVLLCACRVDAAIAFRSGAKTIAAANPVATEPTGAALNDVEVALLTTNDTVTRPSTCPTSWTSLYNNEINLAGSDFLAWRVCWIRRGSGAPSLTWSTSATYTEVYIGAFSGVDTTTAIDSQSAAGGTGNTAGHNITPPSTVAVSAAAMAVTGGNAWQGPTTTYTPPTGYTNVVATGAGENTGLAYKLLSASGTEAPNAFGGVSSGGIDHSYWDGFTITLNPLSGAAPCPPTRSLLGVGCH